MRNEGRLCAIVGAGPATLSIKYLLIAFVGWRQYPLAWVWKVQGLLPHLKFGLYATAENTISYISTNIDYLVIGFYLGPRELGYYALSVSSCNICASEDRSNSYASCISDVRKAAGERFSFCAPAISIFRSLRLF